jgi:hypothetical protein
MLTPDLINGSKPFVRLDLMVDQIDPCRDLSIFHVSATPVKVRKARKSPFKGFYGHCEG